jgi:tRNA pseudouridine13 synthase
MLPRSSEGLPGTGGRLAHASAEEVLAKQPADTGDFMWVKVLKSSGLGTTQVRQALARSVNIPVELVADAGNRDRQGSFVQWFSLPMEPIENPGPIKRAGVHGKMRVLEVTYSHKPFTAACVERVRWKLQLTHANREGGYHKAKAILDHLRVQGVPNYVALSRLGPESQWARWGKLLLRGERLPAKVTRGGETTPGTCLRAFQDWLFNRWAANRVTDGLLARSILGDRLRSRTGNEDLVTDPTHADKRIATWEATVLGPLVGLGMSPVADEAAAREAAVLAETEITAVERLQGDRRALRFQPQKTVLDLEREDLIVTCEIPPEANVLGLVDEILKAPELG